jgi:hypothetical protein
MYYFYNNTDFVITLNGRSMDEMVVAQKIQGISSGDKSIIGAALTLPPKSWIKALITEEKPFNKSLYQGQLCSLKEKGYVRVLTETEYRDECKKAKLESDMGILHQDTSVSSVGVFRKVAEHNQTIKEKETFAFSDLMITDDTDNQVERIEEQPAQQEPLDNITVSTPEQTASNTQNENDARFTQIENTLLELTKAVSALSKGMKQSKRKRSKKK